MKEEQSGSSRSPSSLILHPSSLILGPSPDIPATTRGNVYLPIAANQTDPVQDFCRLLVADSRQQRPHLELCPALQQAAVWRAYGLASGGDPWDHVSEDGTTPNELARRAGCVLPADYAPRGNNIESLVAGTADPVVAFTALANSLKHSDHLFGRGWFQKQRHFGVALCRGSAEFTWYWAIYIATCEGQTSGE